MLNKWNEKRIVVWLLNGFVLVFEIQMFYASIELFNDLQQCHLLTTTTLTDMKTNMISICVSTKTVSGPLLTWNNVFIVRKFNVIGRLFSSKWCTVSENILLYRLWISYRSELWIMLMNRRVISILDLRMANIPLIHNFFNQPFA